MQKITICFFLFCFSFINVNAQTTDLSIVVEAQNNSGSSVSQVTINENFQYLITILNSGNAVSNATFSQTLSTNVGYISSISQNPNGDASAVSNLSFIGDELTGTIANMPSSSSVEVLVIVSAPINPGGIATSSTIFSPNGTTDTNTANNQSIISIDVIDLPIDFSVVYSQVTPPNGTGISNWGDTVTYQFTITNNSSVAFPLDSFSGFVQLANASNFGVPYVQFQSITCLNGTNGTPCTDVSGVPQITGNAGGNPFFSFNNPILFNANSSLSFEIVYQYLEPNCSIEISPLAVDGFIQIELDHINESSNDSNVIFTQLIEAPTCSTTDLCIETTQINPLPSQMVNWNEEVTFETVVCNNGPLDAFGRFFLQNLSLNLDWNIVSITCDATTGNITCNDFTLTDQGQFWLSNNFTIPANVTITITTVVTFIDPNDCSPGTPNNSTGHVRSVINLLEPNLLDSNITNNAESDYVILPPLPTCDPEDLVDLQITKTQIDPILPLGSDDINTISWGNITYEITATNPNSTLDALVAIEDYMPNGENTLASATLVSVNCISTTGTATCPTINTSNIGVLLDGIPDSGIEDVFWNVPPENNYTLPAQSSITFQVVVNWQPECSIDAIEATNGVRIISVDGLADNAQANNQASVITFFAPCVDLIVQTYPEFTQVIVNQDFNWIIDITNSNTSSNAINIDFQDIVGSPFTLNGLPTCTVTNGNASCTTFSISGNTITGVIPNMDAGSTLQIIVPVTAPSYGGAFTNNAQAIPNESDNQELTLETNVSISNVQVIAPTVVKSFTPVQIIAGQNSVLEFTVTNLAGNPAQNNIDFTDNLPTGLSISGPITWVQSNGCTASFSGINGDTSISVNNLMFPLNVSSCSFSVPVTATVIGNYLNNDSNFSDQNNIDTSLANATLEVIVDNTNVDIEVLKTVLPTQAFVGENVTFTITVSNLGTDEATNISVLENLPTGYLFISATTSLGSYNETSTLWSLNSLLPNQTETLSITAQVVAETNLINTANLNDVTQTDRDPTNNLDTAEVVILIPDVDIEVLKSVAPTQAFVGENVTFTITISNLGTDEATNISIFENLPTGYQFLSATPSLGNYDDTSSLWTLNSLLPNQTETLSFTAQVIASNNLINTASLDSVTETDNDLTNNQDTAEVIILIPDIDIEVLKHVSPQETSLGGTVTFTITTTNLGTTNASNVSIFESLPNGYIYLSGNTTYGDYSDTSFLWNLPNLSPYQSETLTITAQVISSNNLLNTASLNGVEEIDQDNTNNADSAQVSVNDCLKITQGISPNSDGENDAFIINCIEDYPENNVKIFNRYGTLVFETNNYKNNWNGIPNKGTPRSNTLLPVGTYYYVITIKSIKDPFSGWVYLNY